MPFRDCAGPSVQHYEGLQKKFNKKNSQVNNYSFIHFFLQPLQVLDFSDLCIVPIVVTCGRFGELQCFLAVCGACPV